MGAANSAKNHGLADWAPERSNHLEGGPFRTHQRMAWGWLVTMSGPSRARIETRAGCRWCPALPLPLQVRVFQQHPVVFPSNGAVAYSLQMHAGAAQGRHRYGRGLPAPRPDGRGRLSAQTPTVWRLATPAPGSRGVRVRFNTGSDMRRPLPLCAYHAGVVSTTVPRGVERPPSASTARQAWQACKNGLHSSAGEGPAVFYHPASASRQVSPSIIRGKTPSDPL